MSRSHGHRFANEALPEALFDNPLAFARTLANQRQGLQLIASAWDRAGALLPAADRVARSGLTATVEQRGSFVAIQITVPPPRENGDPAAIVIVGQGDGVTTFEAVRYFILELGVHAGDACFYIVSRTEHDEHGTNLGLGPPPDMRWFTDHVCELIAKRQPPAPRTPSVPAWYWWHVFGGAAAMRAFLGANGTSPLQIVHRAPILLLPEIAEAADVFLSGGATSEGLRAFQSALRAEASFAPMCHMLATLLASSRAGSIAANLSRAITIVDEAREYGADEARSCAIEADARKQLAALGVDVRANYEAAQRLVARRGSGIDPPRRMARGSSATIGAGDPTWASLFLDESELAHYKRTEDRRSDPAPPGVLHAGQVTWVGDESWPMWRIIDTRMLFATAEAADRYLKSALATIGDGLPALPTRELADATIAFGGATPGRMPNTRHASQSIVVRIGRVVAKLYVAEGPNAPVSGHVLDQAMIVPLAQRIVQRAQWSLARYWLSVGCGTDAATLFVQSPTARLLAEYPILALPELPAAMMTLGGAYVTAAQTLWQLQMQLRGREWQAHRDATKALVRTLLDDRASEPRVNAAYALALIAEMRRLDPNPIWAQLEAECRVHGT